MSQKSILPGMGLLPRSSVLAVPVCGELPLQRVGAARRMPRMKLLRGRALLVAQPERGAWRTPTATAFLCLERFKYSILCLDVPCCKTRGAFPCSASSQADHRLIRLSQKKHRAFAVSKTMAVSLCEPPSCRGSLSSESLCDLDLSPFP